MESGKIVFVSLVITVLGFALVWFWKTRARAKEEEDTETLTDRQDLREVPHEKENEEFEYDIAILHCDEDREDAISFIEHLTNLNLDPPPSVALYECLNPNIQSLLQSAYHERVFTKVRLLFVFLSAEYVECGLSRHQGEMFLCNALSIPEYKDRIVPVWAEEMKKTTSDKIQEFSIFRGLEYWRVKNSNASDRDKVIYKINTEKLIESTRMRLAKLCE